MKLDHESIRPLNRRQWLRVTAGAALTLGLWPGRLRAADNGRGGSFPFVVVNDAHFQSPQCPAWFERVRSSILAHEPRPEFCLMVGDLADHGIRSELGSMRDVLRSLGMPVYSVIGNHDYLSQTDRSPWDALFPGPLNYHFEHRDWRFVGLDTTEGQKSHSTSVQATTFTWLDENMPKLDHSAPTVLFTHFPMGPYVIARPANADELLARFKEFNLVAVYNGHFHGFTERKSGHTVLTTNRCCAISHANHDGTPEKGYFLCTANEGRIARKFIEVKPG